MSTYTLVAIPTAAGDPAVVISGFETQTDAEDSGDGLIADAYFDRYIVVPGPAIPQGITNIYQPTAGDVVGGGGGSANPA